VGASETIATLRILGAEEMHPGDEGWIQLELRNPVVAVRGDRFILRRPSPGETLGGGLIIDHQPKGRHKRFDNEILKSLAALAQGSPADILYEAALGLGIAGIQEIVTRSRLEPEPAQAAFHELLTTNKLISLEEESPTLASDALIVTLPQWNLLRDKTLQLVETYQKDFRLRRGIPREELKSKLKLTPRGFSAILNKLVLDHEIADHPTFVAKVGHEIRFNGQEQAKVDALLRKFESNPFGPPSVKESQAEVGEEILNALMETDELFAVSADVIYRKNDYDLMVTKILGAIQHSRQISLAEVRDMFTTSRKYAQAILEHLDTIGITIRDGDYRKLNPRKKI